MIQDLLEIVVAYYQYLASILQTKGVGYTLPWVRTGESMSFVSLDEAFFSAYIPNVTADARVFFIIVSIIIPLILVFLGLLTLNPPSVVVWYFVLLASVFTLLAGVLAAIISQTVGLNISFLAAQVLMYVGVGGLVLCFVAFLCNRMSRDEELEEMEGAVNEEALEARRLLNEKLALRRTREEREARLREKRVEAGMSAIVPVSGPKQAQEDKEIAELERKAASVVNLSKKEVFRLQTKSMEVGAFVQGLLFGLVLLAVGAILIIGSEVVGIDAGALGTFAFIIGVTFVLIAVLVIAWTLPSVSRGGRESKWHASQFLQENGMRLLILLMMILYIPIGSSSIVIFNCNDFTCPEGYRLIDQGTAVLYNTTNREGRSNGPNPYCYPCNPVPNPDAPTRVFDTACDFRTDSRLESAPEIRCATMQQFFWPAAGLAFVYILGVPILYLRLIAHSTAVLKDDFPVDPKLDDWEQIWEAKVVTSSNVVKFLYQPFEYKYRFWRLAQLMQKLGVVITGAYVFNTGSEDVSSSTISLGSALLIHVTMSIALFITEPFIRLYDDGVATALHACLVSCCVIALCILYDQVPPDEFNIAILSVYLLVPLVLFVVGVHLELRWAREAEEQAEAEQRQRVVEHLEKMDAKQMRAAIEARRAKVAAQKAAEAGGAENPLKGATKRVDSDSDAEGPHEDGGAPIVVEADASAEHQTAAARPMTALNDDGDDGMHRSGYGAVRSIGTARTAARHLNRGRGAGGGDAHAAPSFLNARGRGGAKSPSARSPGHSSHGSRTGSGNGTPRGAPPKSGLVGPGFATESTATVDDGTAEIASPRINSSRFSMRKPPRGGGAGVGMGDSGRGRPPAMDATFGGSTSGAFAGSPSAAMQASTGSPVDLNGSLRRQNTMASSGGSASPRTVHGSMRVGRTKRSDEEDPFQVALAASRKALEDDQAKSQRRESLKQQRRRSSDEQLGQSQRRESTHGGAPDLNRRASAAPSLAIRRKSSAVGVGDDNGFGASASLTDAQLQRELQHSSDESDDPGVEVDAEEEARLAEKRAELMAKVLKAEAARKRRRELIRSGKLTEEDAELARNTRIAAVLGRDGEGDLTSPQEGDDNPLNMTMRTGKFDAAGIAQAQLDGSEIVDENDAVDLELAEQALEVVEEQILDETKEMRDKQGDVDLAMNITAKRTVNRFLMAGGFIGFAALGCSLLGMLAANDDAKLSTAADTSIQHQIGGYLTWGFFTDNCVCMPVRNDRARLGLSDTEGLDVIDVEVWVCANGARVERVRSVVNGTGTTTGTPVRGICANRFGLGCSVLTTRDEKVELQCPSNTTAVVPGPVLALW
eukprot:CAMPEP_0174843636 /NCGR_PEP_ID=MMETSP1114-20130205/10642_1 /TAXON_ID=312471 /ORGANISM="Neobodo designis, Strain CCAP 1951/1" /LENGTH=1331 /DNA_ID=CAMNT_0016077861 /DNA_START=318 /DNA_END=4313 /DNA_ORIENTATION=+